MANDNFAKKLYVRLYQHEADLFENLKLRFGKSKDSDMAKDLISKYQYYYDKSSELEKTNKKLQEQLEQMQEKMKIVKGAFEIINSF